MSPTLDLKRKRFEFQFHQDPFEPLTPTYFEKQQILTLKKLQSANLLEKITETINQLSTNRLNVERGRNWRLNKNDVSISRKPLSVCNIISWRKTKQTSRQFTPAFADGLMTPGWEILSKLRVSHDSSFSSIHWSKIRLVDQSISVNPAWTGWSEGDRAGGREDGVINERGQTQGSEVGQGSFLQRKLDGQTASRSSGKHLHVCFHTFNTLCMYIPQDILNIPLW